MWWLGEDMDLLSAGLFSLRMEKGLPVKKEIRDTTQGLNQSQPGHGQQGVNLTLIIHTTVSSANTNQTCALCTQIYDLRTHSKDTFGVL